MKILLPLIVCIFCSPLAAFAQTAASPLPDDAAAESRIAVLKGLDKITARVSQLEIGIDETGRFGALYITPRTCNKRPPEEPPEVTVFLEIEELQPGESEPTLWYSGWMFQSSPALAAMEHPVYDVWVIDCIARSPDTETGKE